MKQTQYEPLLISFDEAAQIRAEIGRESLMGRSLAASIASLDLYLRAPLEVPGNGEAGGYEHNRHKQNYVHLNSAGRMFLITGDRRYLDFARNCLLAYARKYLDIPFNVSRDSNKPGRLFHQTLNENMWLLYASEAYSCIRHHLSESERESIESRLFRPMVEMFVDTYSHDFDIVHNHGLWSVAAVGMCGYALDDEAIVGKAVFGLRGDGRSGGFLAQLSQLFSPDGYYLEGPYYHRFAMRPLLLFAEAIERRQPELGIYQLKDQVIRRTASALMAVAYPDGRFPALNDSSRTMGIQDDGVLIGTSLCFERYSPDPNLIAMARLQQRVWISSAGLTLSQAAQAAPRQALNWGSLKISDGPAGDRGGVGILRQEEADGDLSMALLWYGQHGSDHTLHDALDHGHFDGLHLSFFNRGKEVLQDYGFGRWVNVEPKFGGRYIPENDSYCKQSIAHNTVTVDGGCQNGGDTALAVQKWGLPHFFDAGSARGSGMSARALDYFPGVDMQRSVLMLKLPGVSRHVLVDLFRLTSNVEHRYDYPLHYQGQIIRTDFVVHGEKRLSPMGEQAGYQHIWEVAGSGLLRQPSVLVSWLHDDTYYTWVSAAARPGSVHFGRIGANDPQFNLRSEPVMILRQQGTTHLFASVLETHGRFDESNEISEEARGRVCAVEVIGHDDIGSVIAITLVGGETLHVMSSNLPDVNADHQHSCTFGGRRFSWQGFYAISPAGETPVA